MTREELEALVVQHHNPNAPQTEDTVSILFCDGELAYTKGRDLFMQRSIHRIESPLIPTHRPLGAGDDLKFVIELTFPRPWLEISNYPPLTCAFIQDREVVTTIRKAMAELMAAYYKARA